MIPSETHTPHNFSSFLSENTSQDAPKQIESTENEPSNIIFNPPTPLEIKQLTQKVFDEIFNHQPSSTSIQKKTKSVVIHEQSEIVVYDIQDPINTLQTLKREKIATKDDSDGNAFVPWKLLSFYDLCQESDRLLSHEQVERAMRGFLRVNFPGAWQTEVYLYFVDEFAKTLEYVLEKKLLPSEAFDSIISSVSEKYLQAKNAFADEMKEIPFIAVQELKKLQRSFDIDRWKLVKNLIELKTVFERYFTQNLEASFEVSS